MLCGLPVAPPINPEEKPRKLLAGADSRFFACDELRDGIVVSPVLPSCRSTPSHPFSSASPPAGFGGDLTNPKIDEVVLDRLCTPPDECFRINLLSRRLSAGGGVALCRVGGANGSTTIGSDAGGGTEAVAVRRIDHRDFDADIGRLPEGRWGLLFRRSERYCSVRFTQRNC